MSKVVKGIGKTFKKVVKTTLKIAPYVLMAAAVVYTGGAAMGMALPGMAAGTAATAGLGTAMTAGVGALGLGATASAALSTGLTYAGMGAAAGAAVSAATGGKISKGIKTGAMVGGAIGAVGGGLGYAMPGMPAAAGAAPGVAAAGTVAADAAAPAVGGAGLAPQAAAQTGASGFWQSAAAGGLISGLGTGIAGAATASSERKAAEETRAAIAKNYTGMTGLMTQQDTATNTTAVGDGRPTPSERFNPRSGRGNWVWNNDARRMVFMPESSFG